jgi:hypothetical protein
MRAELNDLEMRYIQGQLEVRLYGYRKPEESIVGFRVLHESEGSVDLLLMRRDLTDRGFFFDLDNTLGMVEEEESDRLNAQVAQTIETLERNPMRFQEPPDPEFRERPDPES